jgi:hypothetical protein
MPYALLLAMQAAGMITDYIGTQNQAALMGMGQQLQEAAIESNIEQTRLEAEDQSLQALTTLRKNLGTQAALFAARGTRSDAGSALSIVTESIGNFNADERMRRMNLLGKTTALKGQGLISRLNTAGEQSKLWQGFAQRSVNRFSTNPNAYKGSNGSGGIFGTAISSKLGSYGLTQMG